MQKLIGMELLKSNSDNEIKLLRIALWALVGGLCIGVIASIQYFFPHLIPGFGFQKIRPMHVSLLVGWILGSAIAMVWFIIKREFGTAPIKENYSVIIPYLFLFTGILILLHFAVGKFGGREYWEFPQYLAIGILLTWIIFALVFFQNLKKITVAWPSYVWMWLTGVVFFIITFIEGNLWVFEYFKSDVVKDITIQWKSQGALVGSWNMLVYGLSIYLSEKISENPNTSRSPIAYASFFLGFTNLLLGWAHHIYIVPCPLWIRMLSYAVSMTELILVAKIIQDALAPKGFSSTKEPKYNYEVIFKYANKWINYNLILAVLISIPAINIYTHGTYITVAHAMGSTIGINTFILLSVASYILNPKVSNRRYQFLVLLIHNILIVFWVSLIAAGIIRGIFTEQGQLAFNAIQSFTAPFLVLFSLSGFALVLLLVGLVTGWFIFKKEDALLINSKKE